jgi:glycosyltransferase involved in cell wall biosynthesis
MTAGDLPLVSVVTPSFNQGGWIEEAIRSVLDQDYPHIEYLVMDGGSSDGTLDVLRRYDGRFVWTSGPDGGQAQALRTGFARTRGDILGWLNADDAYQPGTIARAVAAFAASPQAGLVFGNAEFMDAGGNPLGHAAQVTPLDDARRLLDLGDCVVQPAAFFRRAAYDAVGGLDADLHWTMDYDLWLRLVQRSPARHLDQTLARVRCTPTTKTASGGWKRLAEIEAVVRRHGGDRLPAWFALEAAAMHAREAVVAFRQVRLGAAATSVGCALRRLADRNVIGALASPQVWRMVRQRQRNVG